MANGEIVEVLVRGAAVGGFLGLAIAVGRGGASSARVTGVLFCLAAAGHTVAQSPPICAAIGWAWPLAWALSITGAGLFWAFATELFGDRERFHMSRFLPAAVLLAMGIAGLISPLPVKKALGLANNIVSNRAFKDATGLTPTEWRRKALMGSPNSEISR